MTAVILKYLNTSTQIYTLHMIIFSFLFLIKWSSTVPGDMGGRVKKSYPSATGKLLCVLLNPGDGELLTYVTSGQGEHCKTRFSFLWYLNNLEGSILYQPSNHSWTFHPVHQGSSLTHLNVPKYSFKVQKTHIWILFCWTSNMFEI